jgi:hypothetical protein
LEAATHSHATVRSLPWVVKLLALLSGIVLLAVALGSCLVVIALVFHETGGVAPGAASPAEADVRNRELMRSLPGFPSSVRLEEDVWDYHCCHPAERYRLMTHVYASDATIQEVIAFYEKRLTEAGWTNGEEVTGGYGFHKKNIDVFLTPLPSSHSENPAAYLESYLGAEPVSVEPANAPPADASNFFAVTTIRRIDCLSVDCLRWPTGSQ